MAEAEKDELEEYVEVEELVHSQAEQLPNRSLAELNMLLVLLSLIYFSADNCIEYLESDQIVREQAVLSKTCISSTKRHEPKLGRKSYQPRFQTTIRDSRHGRKM